MTFEEIQGQAKIEWEQFLCRDRARILVGGSTCGRAAGALDVISAFNTELRKRDLADKCKVSEIGCLGMCYLEILVEIKDKDGLRILYQGIEPDMVPELVESHLAGGKPVGDKVLATMGETAVNGYPGFNELPMIRHQARIVLRNCGNIDPTNINHYIARGGYAGIVRAISEMKPDDVIEEISKSGLRGRGGAGFPTGTKWGFARKSPADAKYMICNADEGDPGAFMDRSVLEGDPHAMLEGLMIGGYAIGASVGYVYCRAEYPLAIERIQIALSQMREKGLLGDDILGSGFDFDIKIKKGAGAFVCGEETALMASIEGRRGMPRSRPPFPANSGLFGKPTNINNVETLASVSAIMEKGAQWYSRYGTEKSKGTKTFALAGKIRRTGLIEVPMGIPLSTIVYDIGGGILDNKKFKAVQTGGPSGGCIPTEHINMPVDYEHLAEVGSIMGSGGMIVIDEDSCMVDVAKYFLGFTEDESCGKCVPCRMGTQHLKIILTEIAQGRGRPEMIDQLRNIGDTMKKTSLCGLGQGVPNPVLSTLRYFMDEYKAHIEDNRCPAVVCTDLFDAPCQHACPAGMDVPQYIALVRARRLDDAYKVLKRTNPFPSVCGRVCGHFCQSKCRRQQLDEPLAIKNLKRFITDNAESRPKVDKVEVTRKEKIAVIGAGPSGLTAALELNRRGYAVTVFEKYDQAGGMMRWGIPEYRLPRDVLDMEIQDILDTGVELKTGTEIGKDVAFDQLKKDFDHIYVAAGAQKSWALGVENEDADGVYGAIEFLFAVNRKKDVDIGKKVAVIGGGNSAIDSARSALRLGADKVTIFYRRERKDMPALPEEISAAEHEGVKIELLVGPVKVMVSNGKVKGLELQRQELGEVDRSARKRPIPIEGSNFTVEVDSIISAIGQQCELDFIPNDIEIVSKRNRVEVDKDQQTRDPNVWAGGDVVTGPAMVIDAIRAGFRAARAIDAAIREKNHEPPWAPLDEPHIDIPVEIDEEVEERMTAEMPETAAADRCGDFREVELGYEADAAWAEACRCLRCDFKGE
jgi:NADH-quinone oxidoreductase subunit F